MKKAIAVGAGMLFMSMTLGARGDGPKPATAETPTAPNNRQEINAKAMQCITAIRQELVQFGKEHPAFKDVEQKSSTQPSLWLGDAVRGQFRFNHHTRFHRHVFKGNMNDNTMVPASVGHVEPEDNGVILMVGLTVGYIGKIETTKRFEVNVGDQRIFAFYFLQLGKDFKDQEAPVKAIIEKHLNHFCDQMKQMK